MTSDTAFFRFVLPTGAVIDNVGIVAEVPEPATLTMLFAGLSGLTAFGRRRRA